MIAPAQGKIRPDVLLLGRFFSFWDILAYWFAISVGLFVDRRIRRTTI
jgi:hypothetical protein